jgi:hypothetical protein
LGSIFIQKLQLHAKSNDTDDTEKAVPKKVWETHTNRRGEEIMYKHSYPPKGYAFVPAGNVYMTRRCREFCRKLALKIYAVYRSKSRNKSSGQMGLHIPKSVVDEAFSNHQERRTKLEKRLWLSLDQKFPKIPSADKSEIHSLVVAGCEGLVETSAPEISKIAYRYVRDQYTMVEYRGSRTPHEDEIETHQKAEEILASWCAEGSGKQPSRNSEKK